LLAGQPYIACPVILENAPELAFGATSLEVTSNQLRRDKLRKHAMELFFSCYGRARESLCCGSTQSHPASPVLKPIRAAPPYQCKSSQADQDRVATIGLAFSKPFPEKSALMQTRSQVLEQPLDSQPELDAEPRAAYGLRWRPTFSRGSDMGTELVKPFNPIETTPHAAAATRQSCRA